MENLKELICNIIGSSAPVGWPGDYVAVYETSGGFQYVVTFDEDYMPKTVGYNGKTLSFTD
jgi:hypothetical protein